MKGSSSGMQKNVLKMNPTVCAGAADVQQAAVNVSQRLLFNVHASIFSRTKKNSEKGRKKSTEHGIENVTRRPYKNTSSNKVMLHTLHALI